LLSFPKPRSKDCLEKKGQTYKGLGFSCFETLKPFTWGQCFFFTSRKCVPVLVWNIELSLVSTLVSILAAQTFPEQGALTQVSWGQHQILVMPLFKGAFLCVSTCQRFAETFHGTKTEQQRALPKCVRLHPTNVRWPPDVRRILTDLRSSVNTLRNLLTGLKSTQYQDGGMFKCWYQTNTKPLWYNII
jgi:hypothetical protein